MEKNDYIRAARILASCPKKRLPQVVKLLREAGLEIDEGILREKEDNRKAVKMERRRERRGEVYDPDFWDSADEFVLTLRNAFAKGIGVSELSREAGVSRTTIYRYLHEESSPSDGDKKRILDGIAKIMNGDEDEFWTMAD